MFDFVFHFTDFCRIVYEKIEDVAFSIAEMPIVQTYIFDIFYHSMKIVTQFQSYFPSSRKVKQPEPKEENWYYFGYYDHFTGCIKHYYSDTYEVHTGVKQTDLWIVKHNHKYISSTSHAILHPLPIQIKSNISFIYIEYISNSNHNTISLHLPEEYLYVGNELFSPAFVLRLLEQQSEPYIFDRHYKICIMDEKLRNIYLNYDQMMVLEKDNCYLVDLHY